MSHLPDQENVEPLETWVCLQVTSWDFQALASKKKTLVPRIHG